MEKEQILEYLKSDEGKEVMSDIKSEFKLADDDSILGLKNKNRELLGKLKEEKTAKEKYEKLLDGVDEDVLINTIDKVKSGKVVNEDDNAKALRELNLYKQEAEKYKNDYISIKKKAEKGLIQSTLQKAFVKHNIDSAHYDILSEALINKLKIEENEGKENIIFDDGEYGKPFDEYMDEFVKTKGEYYVKKPVNSGANSKNLGGSNQSAFTKTDLQDPVKQKEFYKRLKNGEKVDIID